MDESPFGDLVWSEDCWIGTIQFIGGEFPLSIDFDAVDPTNDEKRDAVRLASELFGRLDIAWEQSAKSEAAKEITEAAYSQSEYCPNDGDVKELFDDLVLRSVSFIYSSDEEFVFPYLAYKSPKCFPNSTICIQFAANLSIAEVTVN